MLPGPRFQVAHDLFDQLALEVVGPHLDRLGTADLLVQTREAEAALFVLDKALALDDLRIEEDLLKLGLLGVAADVHDQQLIRQGHLRRRQAETLRTVHGLHHAADVQMELLIDARNRLGLVSQGRMREVNDLHDASPSGLAIAVTKIHYNPATRSLPK